VLESCVRAAVDRNGRYACVQAAVITELPSYHEVRTQLCRHRAVRCLPVPDPLCLPDKLQVTLRGREVEEGDPVHGERFLLHSGQRGRLVVFCADTELAVLHQSDYLVCDGTFEMALNTAYQLYTIHGFKNGEGLPLAWALLPNKTAETYKEMFGSLRSALTAKFGDIGEIKYFLIDFERAAINAIHNVFDRVLLLTISRRGSTATFLRSCGPITTTWDPALQTSRRASTTALTQGLESRIPLFALSLTGSKSVSMRHSAGFCN